MEKVELRALTTSDGQDIYEMLQRIGPSENAFRNDVHGMTYDGYQEWLKLMQSWSKGEDLPEGYVKQWTFWLFDNGIPVGYGKLREKATEEAKRFGGNLGYAIDPIARGMGYGNRLFELLLKKASKLGIKEIYSTVEKYNYISKKVHEKLGGQLVKEDKIRWYYIFLI